MGEGVITIDFRTNNVRGVVKTVKQLSKELRGANIHVKAIDKGVGSLGNRLGFVAFQMTFLAGVAGRALGQITENLKTMVQEGSKDLSTVGRAIVRSGFDISASSGEAREAVNLLNNAMRTFGSGTTIFNVEETAEAFNAVGRAINFTGSEMVRAKKQIVVVNEVMKLMTIEGINAESASINFVKTMEIFSISVLEAARVSDVLVKVNNQSTITLDGLVRSLGFAGQQAREFGLSFEETAATLGVIANRLGVLNGGPGRNFSILLQNLSSTTVSLSADLARMGITLRDSSGQMKGITDIVGQFARALNNAGKRGSLARKQILEMVNATSRGERTLLTLIEGFDDLEEAIRGAEGATGIAERITTAFQQLPEERIARLKNAFNSLKLELVGAMSPAINELVDQLRSLATDSNVQSFMEDFGRTLSQLVIPPIKTIVQLVKGLTTVFKNNEFVLKLVTGGFAALLGVLTALFVIGTVGALVAIMAATVQKLATSTAVLTIATNALFLSFLKFAVAAFGIFLILKGIDKIIGAVSDGFTAAEAPAIALGVAMTALGVAMAILPFKIGGIGAAIKGGGFLAGGKTAVSGLRLAIIGLGSAVGGLATTVRSGNVGKAFTGMLSGISSSIRGISSGLSRAIFGGISPIKVSSTGQKLGGSFSGGFLQKAKLIKPGTKGLLTGLGKAGLIGAAIVAAVAIGLAIKSHIDAKVASSRLFTDGFQTETEAWGFQFKASIASAISETGKAFAALPAFFGEVFEAMKTIYTNFFTTLGEVAIKFFSGDFQGALDALQSGIGSIFDGTALQEAFSAIQGTFDARFLAEEEILKTITTALKESRTQTVTATAIAEILEATKQQGEDDLGNFETLFELLSQNTGLDEEKIIGLINRILNQDAFNSPLLKEANEFEQEKSIAEQTERLGDEMELAVIAYSELTPQLEALKQSITDQITGSGINSRTGEEIDAAIDELGMDLAQGSISIQEFNEGLEALESQFAVNIEGMLTANEQLEVLNEQTTGLTTQTKSLKEEIKEAEKAADDYFGITTELNEVEGSLAETIEIDNESLATLADTQDLLTDKDNINIVQTAKNSTELARSSTTLDLGRKILNLWILEVGRNQNRLIDFTLEVDRASIAFSLLAREGAEAARRLASLKVSTDGKFSIDARQTAGVSSGEVAQLGSGFEKLNLQFKEDLENLSKVDLDDIIRQQELINQLELLTTAISSEGGSGGDTIITNEINITIEGSADEETAKEVADIVAEEINSQIENKETLIV